MPAVWVKSSISIYMQHINSPMVYSEVLYMLLYALHL